MLVIFYYSLCQAVVEPADGVDMVYLRSVICDGGKKGGRVKIWKRNHSIDCFMVEWTSLVRACLGLVVEFGVEGLRGCTNSFVVSVSPGS